MRKARTASWLLRLGLAAAWLYAGLAGLMRPTDWVGYLPRIGSLATRVQLLRLFSVAEVILGIWLLTGTRAREAAWTSMAAIAAILFANLSILNVTFRDIPIFFAAWALATLIET